MLVDHVLDGLQVALREGFPARPCSRLGGSGLGGVPLELREDQKAKSYFANQKNGMRYAVGTNGSVTGFHGHFLIIDDPLNPLAAVSDAELATSNRWVTETLDSRKVDKDISVTILVMQRHRRGART